MITNIPTQQEYEWREVERHMNQMRDIQSLPASERKANAEEFGITLANHPELVAERLGWLLGGSYGYGACKVAWRAVDLQKRPNPILYYLVANLEWNTGDYYARIAWNGITDEGRATVNELFAKTIEACKEERPL